MADTDHPTRRPQATPFEGVACFASAQDVRRPEDLVTTEGNRWSQPGQPTIYLAGDVAVALAEFARHAPTESAPAGSIREIDVRMAAVVDLRTEILRAQLGSPDVAAGVLDPERCRALADRLRADGGYEAMIVPSVAMLDRADRWNLVVFVERLRQDPEGALRVGPLVSRIRPAATGTRASAPASRGGRRPRTPSGAADGPRPGAPREPAPR